MCNGKNQEGKKAVTVSSFRQSCLGKQHGEGVTTADFEVPLLYPFRQPQKRLLPSDSSHT